MNAKFTDAATLQFGSPINFPLQTIRYNRSINLFQEWLGPATGWQNKVLSIAGGGTGATTAGDTRANLGLGSMSTQNNNSVNITGGSITGVSLDITATTGILPLARGGTGASLALGYAGSVLMSNGIQTQYMAGSNITELNASNIASGTISVARLPSTVAYTTVNNIFSGSNVFTGSINIQSTFPHVFFTDTDDTIGLIYSRIMVNNRTYLFQLLTNDATTVLSTVFTASDYGIFVVGGNGQIHAKGDNITNINGSNIATGIINSARLGSGIPSASTFLRGDNTWQVPPTGGGGGTAVDIPSGMIAMFDIACPTGWTRYSQMDNRFPMGSTGVGATGGWSGHSHTVGGSTDNAGGHSHGFTSNVSGRAQGSAGGNTGGVSTGVQTADAGGGFQTVGQHTHGLNIDIDVPVNASVGGITDSIGNHSHGLLGNTNSVDHTPPYYTVVFCRKN